MHHFYLSQKRLIRYLVKYGIASIAILVALNQLRLRRDGLSSWKGGGFGMYAEMHPVYNKVFIKSKSNQRAQRKFEPSRESVLLMQKIRHHEVYKFSYPLIRILQLNGSFQRTPMRKIEQT